MGHFSSPTVLQKLGKNLKKLETECLNTSGAHLALGKKVSISDAAELHKYFM